MPPFGMVFPSWMVFVPGGRDESLPYEGLHKQQREAFMPPSAQLVKKASQSLPPLAANRVQSVFCRGVYLAENTIGGQIMRAAGCQSLSEKPKGVFRQSQQREAFMPPSAAYMEPFPTMARQKHPPGHFRPGGVLCVGRSAGFMPFPGSRSCRPGCGSAGGLRSGLRLRRSCSPPGSRPSGPLPRRFWE